MRARWLVALVLVCWGPEARSIAIHHRALTLAELVRRAQVIIVGHPAVPPERTLYISLAPKGKRASLARARPFERRQTRWTVVQRLKGAAEVGAVLEVDEAGWRQAFERYRKAPVQSPFRAQQGDKTEERILFLRAGQSAAELEWVADGAIEAIGRKAAVLALLR